MSVSGTLHSASSHRLIMLYCAVPQHEMFMSAAVPQLVRQHSPTERFICPSCLLHLAASACAWPCWPGLGVHYGQ